MRFPKPKILLLDVPADSEAPLVAAGYNAAIGTWGRPYVTAEIKKASVIATDALPNYNEQEIIICNLAELDTTLPKNSKRYLPVMAHGSQRHPRPAAMHKFEDETSRILAHGGVIVLFAAPRRERQYVAANANAVTYDNWSLLPELSSNAVSVVEDPGTELNVEPSTAFSQLLRRHLKGSSFSCHFKFQRSWEKWTVLAKNKYGHTVAAALPPQERRRGWIIVMPPPLQTPQFALELVTQTVPEIAPHLFPDSATGSWITDPNYELPEVTELRSQITRIRARAQEEEGALRARIEATRHERGFLLDLLTKSGEELVKAIHQALSLLGFDNVVDVDAAGDGRDLREDLQIHVPAGIILVEAKGISGLPSDEDALQVTKYAAPRMRELSRIDIRGLSIINHQRGEPPLRRTTNPFREVVVDTARANDCALMTTWTLYRITRNFERLRWRHEHIAPLFQADGVVDPVPIHYARLGVVERRMEGVVGIRLENAIQTGDRIAVDAASDYHEQQATSIQVNNEPLNRVAPGTLVGVATAWSKAECDIGSVVYHVAG